MSAWRYHERIGTYEVWARLTRNEIIVILENSADKNDCGEYGMAKVLGLEEAAKRALENHQAHQPDAELQQGGSKE